MTLRNPYPTKRRWVGGETHERKGRQMCMCGNSKKQNKTIKKQRHKKRLEGASWLIKDERGHISRCDCAPLSARYLAVHETRPLLSAGVYVCV
jgi:hypothetical protein